MPVKVKSFTNSVKPWLDRWLRGRLGIVRRRDAVLVAKGVIRFDELLESALGDESHAAGPEQHVPRRAKMREFEHRRGGGGIMSDKRLLVRSRGRDGSIDDRLHVALG